MTPIKPNLWEQLRKTYNQRQFLKYLINGKEKRQKPSVVYIYLLKFSKLTFSTVSKVPINNDLI